MRRPTFLPIILATAFLIAPAASAQTLSKSLRNSGVTPEDFAIMRKAAQSLYESPAPQVGETAPWTNADSGSHGEARLVHFRDECAQIESTVYPGGKPQPRHLNYRMCKAADGRWLLMP